jgi:hypothetical protein
LGIRKPWKNLWEIDGTGGFGWFIGCWSHTWARGVAMRTTFVMAERCWKQLTSWIFLTVALGYLRLLGLRLSYEVSWGSW